MGASIPWEEGFALFLHLKVRAPALHRCPVCTCLVETQPRGRFGQAVEGSHLPPTLAVSVDSNLYYT